jgi:DNA-binding XRE family transcriptional regulator
MNIACQQITGFHGLLDERHVILYHENIWLTGHIFCRFHLTSLGCQPKLQHMHSARERLRQWIDRFQFNQRQAADLLGIDQTYISQLLNGKRTPGLEMAVRIEHAMGIPAAAWVAQPVGGPSDLVSTAADNGYNDKE